MRRLLGGGTEFARPNVSHCISENEVHYNPYIPPFFCKLTLNNGPIVELEGSGELTSAMTSSYKSSIVNAEIGELCTSIGRSAFNACSGLTEVVIPDGITSIEHTVFASCTGLTSVTIPNGVTSIGSQAFWNCSSLTSITMPSSVTSIGNLSFGDCTGLTSITIESTTPPELGGFEFENTNCPIYVPAESVDTYKAATYWDSYASRIQPIAGS